MPEVLAWRLAAGCYQAVRRVQAAARGEAGTLQVVYTLTTAYHTVPALLNRMTGRFPQLRIRAREVFAADIPDLLQAEECDLALAPAASYPHGPSSSSSGASRCG